MSFSLYLQPGSPIDAQKRADVEGFFDDMKASVLKSLEEGRSSVFLERKDCVANVQFAGGLGNMSLWRGVKFTIGITPQVSDGVPADAPTVIERKP